jgi:hypothetical protein
MKMTTIILALILALTLAEPLDEVALTKQLIHLYETKLKMLQAQSNDSTPVSSDNIDYYLQ